ncbi:hypothetical protein TRVL_08565 [Trypanosoma vivax]|nr:hypothetical protein TRVL_08565 [Trypanosoma vivax]
MSKSRSVRHRREIPCRHRSDSSHSSASMGRGPHQLRGEARRFDEKSSPGGVEGLQQLISGHGNQLLPHCGNMRRRDEDDTEHHPLITGESHAAPSRVTLYGVDLGVQPCHVSSMLEQLVGQRPLNVFRPVAELWRSCRRTMGSTPENMEILGFCEDGHIVAPENRLHLGLHDVRGAGGVMLVELSQANDVLAVVTALNGACVNGRQITAIANS